MLKVLVGVDYDGKCKCAASTKIAELRKWAAEHELEFWRISDGDSWVDSNSSDAWQLVKAIPYPLMAEVLL